MNLDLIFRTSLLLALAAVLAHVLYKPAACVDAGNGSQHGSPVGDPDPQVREKAVAGLVLLGLRK